MQGEMWVINTDAQVLASHLCSNKMQIGLESTRGLGCGGNPEVGRVAAEESAEGLKKVTGVTSNGNWAFLAPLQLCTGVASVLGMMRCAASAAVGCSANLLPSTAGGPCL
jgi:hypothetical protein